jgi:hypothetical protein
LDQHNRPLFGTAEGSVDEGFLQIESATRQQIFGQGAQNPLQTAFSHPLLETSMAGLVWRILARQVLPAGSGAQNPEHTIEHGAGIAPRPTATIAASFFPEQRLDHFPLGIVEVHALDVPQIAVVS